MAKVSDFVTKKSYRSIEKTLGKCYPDEKTKIRSCHVDAVILTAWQSLDPNVCIGMGIPKPKAETVERLAKRLIVPEADDDPKVLAYYDGHARHMRKIAPHSRFTHTLPCVRVVLPKKRAQQKAIYTNIGRVVPGDHLMFSVDEIAFAYQRHVEKKIGHVELITPARVGAARFGAIAVFLGYEKKTSRRPHCYVLEAGLATGESRVPFLGECIDDRIERRRSWYVPTPFAGARDYYSGHVEVKGHELTRLYIESIKEDETRPYIMVDVNYEKTSNPSRVHPASLLVQAAGRLARIAKALDVKIDQGFMLPIGYLEPWEKKPQGT